MLSSTGVQKERSSFRSSDPPVSLSDRVDPSQSSTLPTLLQSSKIKARFPYPLKLSRDPRFPSQILQPNTQTREKKNKHQVLICHADKPRILRLSCVSNDAN